MGKRLGQLIDYSAYQKAKEDLEAAQKEHGQQHIKTALAWFNLGKVCYEFKNLAQTRKAFKQALIMVYEVGTTQEVEKIQEEIIEYYAKMFGDD